MQGERGGRAVDQLAGKYTVTGDGYCVSGKPVTLSVKLSDDVRDKFTFKGWYLGDSGVPWERTRPP